MESSISQMLAWAGQTAAAAPESQPFPLHWLLALLAMLYFTLIYLPGKREKARQAEEAETLVKGAYVITAGGIHGRVDSVDKENNTVSVSVAPGTVLKFNRGSIVTIKPREGKEGAKDSAKDNGKAARDKTEKAAG
jgi:preprotein translocase subunit YajC